LYKTYSKHHHLAAKRIIYKTLKILGWVAAVIILVIIALVIAIQIPAVQEFAKTKAVNYLHSKINTPVSIGRLSVQFPNNITIEKVYLEDEHKDTLLYGEKIKVDIGIWQLLNNDKRQRF
jgi:translocation and assembly module TamB